MKYSTITVGDYLIKVTYTNDTTRLYTMYNKDDEVVAQSFNRDSFLLKANKIVKLNPLIEDLIASI